MEMWVISSAIMSEWHLTFWNASREDVGSALNNSQPDTRCVSHSITFPGKPPSRFTGKVKCGYPECPCISLAFCSTFFEFSVEDVSSSDGCL